MKERKELDFLRIVVKDVSSLAKQVSWLNFEPRCQTQVIMSQLNTSKNVPSNVTINSF